MPTLLIVNILVAMEEPGKFHFKSFEGSDTVLRSRIEELQARLALELAGNLATRTGVSYLELGQGRGEFHLEFLGSSMILTYPDFNAVNMKNDSPIAAFYHLLVLYYFLQSDGALKSGKWISYSELPGGRTYSTAFQGYTGDELVRKYGFDISRFRHDCRLAGGIAVNFGDAAYQFNPFPRVDMLITYYLGDEDFPSSCKILFEGNTGHYLPTEACAILGGALIRRIK